MFSSNRVQYYWFLSLMSYAQGMKDQKNIFGNIPPIAVDMLIT